MRFVLLTLVALFLIPTFAQRACADEALSEVNAKRAAKGLRAFVYDPGLTAAAQACADYRAANLMFNHTANDFVFVPSGASASAAGCAAYPASYGWMSCCTYEGYIYAGAAFAMGRDGKRYMHLFVSNTPSVTPDAPQLTTFLAPPTMPLPPPPTVTQTTTVTYQTQQRGLFGRRTVYVPVTTGACASPPTTTVSVGVTSTSSCASGSCNVGGRTTVRVRIR